MSSGTKAIRAANAQRFVGLLQGWIVGAIERYHAEHGAVLPRSLVLHPDYGDDGLPALGASTEVIWFDRHHLVRGLALYAPDGVDAELAAHFEYTADGGANWTPGMSANATIAAGAMSGGAMVTLGSGAGIGGTAGTVSLVDYPRGYGVRLYLDDLGSATRFNAQLLCEVAVGFVPLAGLVPR